ncbi:MAG: polysaccharide deacetylase family protein [Candidatus Delongbacteria bacterium]|nr:polysaccharide deacetylase family protein [Candidatus Delongbacteria bacterium]
MIIMYHNIGDKSGFNTVSLDNFKRQIEFLKSKYSIVSLGNYIQELKEHDSNDKIVTITFDDAYKSYIDQVIPYLEVEEIQSIVFVPVSHVGKYNVWDKGSDKIDIMNWEDLKEVSQNLFVEIGSHGLSHSRISKLNNHEIFREIKDSKDILEKKLFVKINHFNFPYGQLNDLNFFSMKILGELDYISACTARYNNKNSLRNIFSLNRIEVEPNDNIDIFKNKCERHYHKKYFKRIVKEMLINLRLIN